MCSEVTTLTVNRMHMAGSGRRWYLGRDGKERATRHMIPKGEGCLVSQAKEINISQKRRWIT